MIELYKIETQNFLQHEMYIYHQFKVHKILKENLKEDEALIYIDFSENYNCKYNTEIQAIHFGGSREQICLHTGYIHTKTLNQGFATISGPLFMEQ